jgi:CheY-like chemotaxis protein
VKSLILAILSALGCMVNKSPYGVGVSQANKNWEEFVTLLAENPKLAEQLKAKSKRLDLPLAPNASSGGDIHPHKSKASGNSRSGACGAGDAMGPQQAESTAPPVMIVVDDDADDFVLLKRALWKAGSPARVWWAKDANEALSILGTVQSAGGRICIVSDLRLPDRDGLELLRQVRQLHSPCRVRFALLTGLANEETEARAKELGADAFYVKPAGAFDLVEIARALQTLASA